MQITLNGQVYRPVRTSDGTRVVIVETGARTSRMVDQEVSDKVLAGFLLSPLRF